MSEQSYASYHQLTASGHCRGWEAQARHKARRQARARDRDNWHGPPLPAHIEEERRQEALARSRAAYQAWVDREREIEMRLNADW